MSDQSSLQQGRAAKTFVPITEAIERRSLMSAGLHGVLGHALLSREPNPAPPTVPVLGLHLPRTGGVSIQVGAVADIGVGQRFGNTVQINDEGTGSYRAEWNGGPVHSFADAQAVAVFAKRATHDQIMINLADQSVASPLAELHQNDRAAAVDANAGKGPELLIRRTSGNAVQSGTALSVTVNKPTSNQLLILDQGGGAVEVEWNGGTVHSFTGVTTILVQAEKARNDQVTFYTPPLT
jgi:hypothetical protein